MIAKRKRIWKAAGRATAFAIVGVLIPAGAVSDRSGADGSDVEVKVHEASTVAGDHFALKEIADVTGADRAFAAQVGAIEIGVSPLPGQSRLLFTGDIQTRIRFNHLDPRRIRVIAAPEVRVSRDGVEIPVTEMVQAATDRLLAERKALNDGATVEPIQLPVRGFTASGKREYQAVVGRGSVENGPVTMLVTVLVSGAPVRTVEIPFRIKRGVQVLMATRPLGPHAVLTADDVTLGTVDASQITGTPLTDPRAVIGMRTARQMAQGAIFVPGMVELAPVIAYGAHVTLEMVTGGIHLRTGATAHGVGVVGQPLRVETDTHKEFTAVVVDATTVRVEDRL